VPELPESLTLCSGPVVLRDWRVQDAPVLEAVAGDPEVCRFTSVPWTYTTAAAREWVARQARRRADGDAIVLAVSRGERAPAEGNVNLGRFSESGREAALGYWIVPAARGHGLAVTAARTLCDWGFDKLGLERIELAILPDNAPSQRVAERLGAEREGLRRGSRLVDGRAWDWVIYALTRNSAPRAC
jgi:RimJ/RimL family protein N-acetyltransferase